MARQTFGKTWWGKAWIEALHHIDYSNRLPRGRSYANEGAVREIEISDCVVLARVQGRRKLPYRISIRLEPFSAAAKEAIRRLINENPMLAAELSLGRLPEALPAVMKDGGLRLFPAAWKEIKADCSCPDWANPCKHLAAVYLVLANEIDKDPFIFFELRGIGRKELTEAAGFGQAVSGESRFVPVNDVKVLPAECVEFSLARLVDRPGQLKSIFSLLSDSPLFYRKDNFKKLLMKAYKSVARAVEKEMESLEESPPHLHKAHIRLMYGESGHPLFHAEAFYFPGDALGSDVNHKLATYTVPIEENGALKMRRIHSKVTTAHYFLRAMLSKKLFVEGTPEIRFLSAAASTALLLARASLFVPEVVGEGQGNFYLRYRPLIRDEQVRQIVDTLAAMMPPGLIYRKKNKSVLTGRDGAEEVLSLYLSFLVREYAEIPREEKICESFFIMTPYEAEKFEEKQTVKAVADWLAPLAMAVGRFAAVIRVELPAGRQKKFSICLDVEDRDDPMTPPMPLADVFAGHPAFGCPAGDVLAEVGRVVAVAGEYRKELKELLAAKGGPLAVSGDELISFLSEAKGVLSMLGISIILPKELRSAVSARLVLSAKSRSKNISFLSLAEMLDFSLDVALGDMRLSGEEFIALTSSAKGIVRFRDRYLMLDPADVNRLLAQLKKPLPKMDSAKLLQASLTGETGAAAFEADETLKKLLADLHNVHDVTVPPGLVAQLRPYQERGFRWLYTNRERGLGSCLADDMGLGKTLQVITLLLKLKEEGGLKTPALIVCPTTLLSNWEKECARFAPGLQVAVCHGPDRNLTPSGVDVILTSYGVVRNDKKQLAKTRWSLLIIDEAQNIKNADTAQSRALKEIKAGSYIAMSGTPVENRLDELWSIFDFLIPGYLGSRDAFSRRFAVPIEKYRDYDRAALLRKATAPFILRRMKTDKKVISDLPDKIIKNQYCRLTPQQAALYQQVLQRELTLVENSEGMERRGIIFRLMTSLKQICNHPVHFSKTGTPLPAHSGKAELAFERIRQIIRDREKALIFTQYKQMGGVLIQMLESELGGPLPFFHGSLQRKKREQLVEIFQNDLDCPLMVVSLKAGGTGLNLTAASHVLHYDLWWNPAVEDQATDRAYRIGQTKNVTIHRFVTLGTLEEKIDAMLSAKKELAAMTISAGETWLTELSNRELKELFTLSTT
ncbi:MAG: DEAD/DEAH box helicase [Dethiobacter sp.]|jgi:uncharacterized Zn finger protein/superfamily II DNA or RNA helicase|nr:DEAD/DEAH box helicase [Dethiobacter sp.]